MQQRQCHCVQSAMLFNSFVKNRMNYFKSSPLFTAVELWYLINSRMIKTRTIQATLIHALTLNWQYHFFSMFNYIIIYLLTQLLHRNLGGRILWLSTFIFYTIFIQFRAIRGWVVFGFWVTIPSVCDLGTFINILIRSRYFTLYSFFAQAYKVSSSLVMKTSRVT